MTKFGISKEDMEGIMKNNKYFEEYLVYWQKVVAKQLKIKKRKKCVFISVLSSTLGAISLGKLLAGKEVIVASKRTTRAGKNL